MKNIVLLMAIVILALHYVCCNDRILSKFHQHAYKLKDVRVDLVSYDEDYINFFEIKTFKFNRTTVAHNVTLNLKVDARDKIESVIQYYKFLSNEYRPLAVRFQINLQKGFKSNAMGVKAISKCGNTTSFYFYKNITYHACNFVVDETQFPPLIPSGRYKLEETMLFDNKEVAVLNGYGEVYTPMVYPKK